jgi:hypothetical protein
MIPYRLLVAALLLSSPCDGVESGGTGPVFEELAPAVRDLAISWEILDPRESGHVLAKADEFSADLKLLRGRHQDLAGAPFLTECQRFPRRAIVTDLISFNRILQKDLEARLPLDPVHAEDLRLVLQENEQLFNIWERVREARCEYYYVTVRRQALKQLRTLIGPEAYYTGMLPPNVPTWRIPEN